MTTYRLPLLLSLALACGIAGARAEDRPIVAELFTSQGCSSCPPAEALLGELAARPEMLALAMHIDYWDNLGWKDPFSTPAATARQKAYNAQFEVGGVYTPQMVIDGHWQAVGSDVAEVKDAILLALRHEHTVPMRLAIAQGVVRAAVAPDAAANGATVWLVGFDRRHDTTPHAGENRGRALMQVNIVRGLAPIGRSGGGATALVVPLAWHCDRVAALLQQPNGQVIGVAVADVP